MKRFLLSALLVFLVMGAHAQSGFRWGVKAGFDYQNVDVKSANHVGDVARDLFRAKDRVGWHIGLQTRIGLGFLSIRPELLYAHSSFKFREEGWHATVRVQAVDLPVLLSLHLFGPLSVEAGPSFNLMNDSKLKDGTSELSLDISSRPTVSYVLGLALDFGRISLTGRYNGEFKRYKHNFLDQGSEESLTLRSAVSAWQLSVGFWF